MREFTRDGRDSPGRGFGGRDRRDRSDRGYGGRGFGRRDSDERFRGRRRDSDRSEMFEIICDKCGRQSEVPFKPTSSKPVYCSDCFKKKGPEHTSAQDNNLEFDKINEKLNKIMKALKIE